MKFIPSQIKREHSDLQRQQQLKSGETLDYHQCSSSSIGETVSEMTKMMTTTNASVCADQEEATEGASAGVDKNSDTSEVFCTRKYGSQVLTSSLVSTATLWVLYTTKFYFVFFIAQSENHLILDNVMLGFQRLWVL